MKKSLAKEWKADLPEAQEDDLIQKALRQEVDAALRKKWADQLAEKGVGRNPVAKLAPLKRRRMYQWAIAATLLVLIGAAWWLFIKPSPPEGARLADQYFLEIADQVAQTRKGESGDGAWQKAQDLYAQQKFEEAIQTMESLAATSPLDAQQYYLLAFCQMRKVPPAFDLALASLEAARQANITAKSDDYAQEIEWANALVLLKKGDAAAAADQLKKIELAGGWYASKAKELLGAMK